MNWQRRPDLVDRLAAEYALGTMTGGARRRFEAGMQAHPDVARAAARWSEQFLPLAASLPDAAAGEALLSRIETRLFDRAEPANVPWWRRLFGAAPAAALAFGLVAGFALPTLVRTLQPEEEQFPDSYVGVLATPQGQTGLIVASRRQGRVLDVKLARPMTLPPDRVAVLWTLDETGQALPVATLPSPLPPFGRLHLSRPSEELFARAVELAVSIEAAGATPAVPSAPFVFRGLCGKLWPPKPAR